jgi:hypothetical protein
MRPALLLGALAFAACASPPQATTRALMAGWDFSQYFGDGLLSVDGAGFTDRLPANYSDLDATYGAGAESAAYGTLVLDGTFGSTDTPLDYTDPVVPSAAVPGSLRSLREAPPRGVPFECFTALRKEGQAFANPFALAALAPARVVFEASLAGVPESAAGWRLRFAARTSGGASRIELAFSSDGERYAALPHVAVDEIDRPFDVPLSAKPSERAFVRFAFAPEARQLVFVDNVAIDAELVVPETGATPLAAPQPCPPAA